MSFERAGLIGGVLTCLLLREAPAHACAMPPPNYPVPPDVVGMFEPAFAPGTQPTNAALLFFVRTTTPSTEAMVRLQIAIEVSREGAPIAGTMKPVEGLGGLDSLWQWLPDGASSMPAALYHVKVTKSGLLPATVDEYDMQVDDQAVPPPEVHLTVDVARMVVGDETGPKIDCGVEPCSSEKRNLIPTRYLARANISLELSTATWPFPYYVGSSARIFSRTNGVVVEEHTVSSIQGGVAGTHLSIQDLPKADEYCVSVSVWRRTSADAEHPTTVERCKAHGTLDLSMSADQERAALDSVLARWSCKAPPVSPTPEDPSGAQAAPPAPSSSSESGCAATPIPSRTCPTAAGALIAVGLVAATRRRRRRGGRASSR